MSKYPRGWHNSFYDSNHFAHYYPRRFRMGPSRLLWFAFGAGFASWWICRKEYYRDGDKWGHCRRPAVTAGPTVPPNTNTSGVVHAEDERWHSNGPPRQWKWDEDKIAKQMTEITDATLDSVLATTQALKQKLAEHRAEREQQEKEQARRNQKP